MCARRWEVREGSTIGLKRPQAPFAPLTSEHARAHGGEAAAEGDMLFLREARDDHKVGCVDKAFAWYMHAVAAFPAAAYIGKTDDDSLNVCGTPAAARPPARPSARSPVHPLPPVHRIRFGPTSQRCC